MTKQKKFITCDGNQAAAHSSTYSAIVEEGVMG